MTHELLNDFGVSSIGIQDRPERMTEGVPTDALPQANLVRCSLDVNAIDKTSANTVAYLFWQGLHTPNRWDGRKSFSSSRAEVLSTIPSSSELAFVKLRSLVAQFSVSQLSAGCK